MLSVSTRVRYGLRALACMAVQNSDEPITVQSIATNEGISQKYLESIFTLLKKGRIVRSRRGPEGGYILDRSPVNISAYEIFLALDGPLATIECYEHDNCNNYSGCKSRDFWCDFNDYMMDYLKKKNLEDILDYHTSAREVQV